MARLSPTCRSADRSGDYRPVTWRTVEVCDSIGKVNEEVLSQQQVL
jgi:hypothetical protein